MFSLKLYQWRWQCKNMISIKNCNRSKIQAQQNLRIFLLNIFSIKKNFSELLTCGNEKNPDIICLCKTYAKEEEVKFYTRWGYDRYDYCRPSDTKGGGLMLFIKQSFNSQKKMCNFKISKYGNFDDRIKLWEIENNFSFNL